MGVEVGVGVGVDVAVGVAVAVAVAVAVGVGVGVGVTHGPLVVIVMVQPPATCPVSPAASSTRYRLHVPLGLVPLKIESITLPEGTGAGAGHVSPAP